MATSRAIKKPKRDDTALANYQPMVERAPSVERQDTPTIARIIAMVGLFLLVLGTLAMLAPRWQRAAAISPDWGLRFASIGLCLLLYHVFVERDFQFRRMYGCIGLALVLGGIVLRIMAMRAAYMNWFLVAGLPAFLIGLVVIIAALRHETDLQFRSILLYALGVVGGAMILYAGINGFRSGESLAGDGVALLILGLLYVCAYIAMEETGSDYAHYAALGLGGAGLAGLVAGVVASFMPQSTFLIPGGLIIIAMSILYIGVAVGILCDWPVIVIARRDLAAYFYSPVGYLVLIGMNFIGGFVFANFLDGLLVGRSPEPIIGRFIFSLYPVITQMFIVPAVTMRLFSEEKRTGTLEVLMTAPVNEIAVVVGKFLACFLFYMLTWLPWWLYLVSLRYIGNEPFDYLPVISFTAALAAVSAGLVAMGLFFSSVTNNQIIAAVFMFVAMLIHLVFYLLVAQDEMGRSTIPAGTALAEVIRAVNFLDLWLSALWGTIAPRYLMLHASIAVFFLFVTVKVLESRKWK
ncbi:MAG: ABC transporter permease [Planctomycetes bacterium]|nr:ABC transporter permease [Planctomycetota bacterium]